MVFDFAIIGAGASGMLCAIKATLKGKRVIVFEHKDRILKKVLTTGNGRCNFTNLNANSKKYTSNQNNFVDYLFDKYPVSSVIDFFSTMGILAVEGKNGKIYPNSLQAASVVDAIRNYANFLNIPIKLDVDIKDIKNENGMFSIFDIKAKKLVLATGGFSYKELGSDGSGYEIAKKFGHSITKLSPILVQLKADKSYIKGLEGIRLDVRLSMYKNNKLLKEDIGELLFTPYGISGPTVFNLSYLIPKYGFEVDFYVDFMPNISLENLKEMLYNRRNQLNYLEIADFLTSVLPKKLGQFLLKQAGVEKLNEMVYMIDDKTLSNLSNIIKRYNIKCYDTMGFKQAQVTAGGVDTREIDNKTFMSKKVNNLYFCGEILDVYGECGGYNLQFAFASGMLVGENND
ncbi:BaiN/RdsA family NAD(P)/FAD-dependent oxidoreductase [Caviibacter abscessus]|uniref:NAD(P)/FAD-dependent oxidoreductase n=1 Tax=Caviibacter abscessus TaxID=1766719 RepID=UPI00083700D6|nr:NAD(P)/FAD-dependent oxidoreductase [Caviibacter abscessus]